MVVGKNSTALQRAAAISPPPKLPPLRKLRVRKPDMAKSDPCQVVMATVLSCWASSGYTTTGCAAVEQQLRTCMDTKKAAGDTKNRINHHLSRLYPQIKGPQRRK